MNNIKKIFVSIISVAIIMLIAYAGYKVLGTSTNEMLSEGDGLPSQFPYITYNDLITEKDTLCSGKGITLIGEARTTVSTGGESQSEPYLTMNDIGKKLFSSTASATGYITSSSSFLNPYSSTTSYTYGYYTESGKKVASPEEAYVLAEISENVPSEGSTFYNITNEEYTGDLDDICFYNIYGTIIYGVNLNSAGEPQDFVVEENGKYYYIEITDSGSYFPYTYVQYAWWKTDGGGNSSAIPTTAFSTEAEAFEAYIEKVAKRDSNGNIVTEEQTVTVNGKTTTITAPVIDYEVSGNSSNVGVQYDEDNGRYLIGPFTLSYYEESATTTSRGTVDFSFITNATLTSNLGEVDSSKWFFKFVGRTSDDTATYPHNNEQFYIVLDYIDGMRYISSLNFDFKYMNAGGEYSTLTGEYFKATWEPESEAVWCNEGATEDNPCSHGYTHNHIVKWEYWLELSDLTPGTSQPLAQTYVGVRWYEKASYSFSVELPDEPDEPDEPEEYIRLTITMAGEVWIDKTADKENADYIDGTRQDDEEGYENAEVYIYKVYKDESGTIVKRELMDIYDEDNETKLSYPIYTDSNGNYTIPNINVPGSGDMIENGYTIEYDVEFKYDGQTYEASTVLATSNGDETKYISASKEEKVEYENDSLASEDEDERNTFNEKFTQIYGGNSIDTNGNTDGYATNGTTVLDLDYTSTEYSIPNNSDTRRLSTLTTTDSSGHILEQYKMSATTGNTGIYFPVNHKITLTSADDVKELSVIENETGKTTTYKTIYNYMLHINLAVKERDEADLSVFKDLYKAEMVVNEKEITKTYNKYVDVEDEENADALEIQIEACTIGTYTLGLYSSDYEYRSTVYSTSADVVKNIKADTELKVYLTYRIAINNESQTEQGLEATINQINDYYDDSFTFVSADISTDVLNDDQERESKVVAESPYYRVVGANETATYTYWSDGMSRFTCNDTNTNVNDDYKKLTITDFSGVKLAAGEQLELFITFEVDQNGYKDTAERVNLLGEKNNIAEIANYSTYYSNGKVAGIIDRDSAPDNIDLTRNVKSWYEDDTESAPAVKIELYQYNREISGNVWEDEETTELLYNQMVANGIMDDGESGIANIDVQLVEKIQIDGIEYEKIWSEDDFTNLTSEEKQEYHLKDVQTNENGYYYFKGVLAGNYVIRFKYGNSEATVEYNGQDYKNTAYQTNMTNDDGTSTLNNEYQDLKITSEVNQARVSDARDYELQRMKVIAYSKNIDNAIGTVLESADQNANHTELIENTQMVANTAKLNIEIEHQDYIDYGTVKTVDGINEYTYSVENIDFGLEKRSETVIELDKKIASITLYKDNESTELLKVTFNADGTVDKEKADSQYNSKITHVDELENIQGLEYLPIESSFLNGSSLKIEYTVTVTNNSEVDWTGKIAQYTTSEQILNKVAELETTDPYVSGELIEYGDYVGLNYYNNKNNDTDQIVKTKVTQIIDYIDNDVSPDEDKNSAIEDSSWKTITLEELQSGNMLDSKVYTDGQLLDSKGVNYTTDTSSNILVTESANYNPSLIYDLVPSAASEGEGIRDSGEIRVVISKTLSEETSSDDIYNNIAEVLSYTNTVGRRDDQAVPGNAQIALGEYIAATGYKEGQLVTDYEGAKEVEVEGTVLHLNGERDTDAPNYVTITEPTGISTKDYNKQQYAIAIVIAGIVLVAGIVIIKKKVIK